MRKSIRNLNIILKKITYILSDRQKKYCIALGIMIFVGAFFEMLGVSAVVPLIQVILSPETVLKNPSLEKILSALNINNSKEVVLLVGAGTIIIYIIKNLYMTFLSWIRVRFASKVQLELSVNMMKSYMSRGYVYFLNVNTGDILRGIQNDVQGVYEVLLQGMRILTELLSVFCICLLIVLLDWKTALCIMSFAIIGFLTVSLNFKRYLQKIGKEYQKYTGIVNSSLLQSIQGIKEVIIMGCQKYFIAKYEDAFNKRQKAVVGQIVAAESPAFLIEAICVSGMILVVCLSALNSTEATSFISSLGAFAIAAFRILPSIGKITNYMNNFLFYYPSVDSVYENIKNAQLYDNSNKLQEKRIQTDNTKPVFTKELELQNISWKYPNAEKNVVLGLNILIKKGTSVGFIGASGAGKTTIADIILGLLHPQEGKILIDGIDISEYSGRWNKLIGYVPQNIYLLDDTIRNNVAFGIDADRIDDQRVWDALEQSQLKSFVEEMPDKLSATVGERGIRFSGGQRQRMAIARALYHNPEILVLDEATSALDTETEKAVMEAIDMLHNQKTLIIVAHRLTTIKNCDTIYEISDGIALKKDKRELNV